MELNTYGRYTVMGPFNPSPRRAQPEPTFTLRNEQDEVRELVRFEVRRLQPGQRKALDVKNRHIGIAIQQLREINEQGRVVEYTYSRTAIKKLTIVRVA